MLALNDEGALGNEDGIRKKRHAFLNGWNAEVLKEEFESRLNSSNQNPKS
jgi:hypothetical protein